MTRARPGVVSGRWKEWDGIGLSDDIVLFARGFCTDVEDAERSVRRLGIEYDSTHQHVELVPTWAGFEPDGSVLCLCNELGELEDGTVLDQTTVFRVTVLSVVDDKLP